MESSFILSPQVLPSSRGIWVHFDFAVAVYGFCLAFGVTLLFLSRSHCAYIANLLKVVNHTLLPALDLIFPVLNHGACTDVT